MESEKKMKRRSVLFQKGEKIRMQDIQSAVAFALLNDARYVDFVGSFAKKTGPLSAYGYSKETHMHWRGKVRHDSGKSTIVALCSAWDLC